MARVYKPISKLGKVVTGKTPSTSISQYWSGNIPFITPTDINGYDTYYIPFTERSISDLGAKSQIKTALPPNSVCVTCIGSTIGKLCLTKTNSISNQQINSIIPNEDNDYRYLYYLIRETLPYFQLIAGGSGSGTPIISKAKFEKIKVPVEDDKEKQIVIAKILSAYDLLIENNNRRIKLLERMAENLYREWFVRFRFPGHESTPIVDGLPQGWGYESLDSICRFERGKNITAAEMQHGYIPVISAGLTPSGFHNVANVKATSLTISSSGANAGYLSIHYDDIWAADCSYISSQKTSNIYFVYELLNMNRVLLDSLQRGAAQPHVYPKEINKIKLPVG